MSEWFYVSLVYGLTWATFVGYMLRLHLRRVAAERALIDSDGSSS